MNPSYGTLRVLHTEPASRGTTQMAQRRGRLSRFGKLIGASFSLPQDTVYLLTQQVTTIGRGSHNTIVLRDPTVSREHARLTLQDGFWNITNLSVQNVVRINDHDVPRSATAPVRTLDILTLGGTELQLVAPDSHLLQRMMADTAPITAKLKRDAAANAHTEEDGGRSPAPLPISDTAASRAPSQPQPAGQVAALNVAVLGPGITLQFALPQRMGRPMRWGISALVLLLFTLCAILTIELNTLIGVQVTNNGGFPNVLAAATIPLLPAVGIATLVNFMDRFEREPWFLRLGAFLWGAIIAIPPAFFVERVIDHMLAQLHPGALSGSMSLLVISMLRGLNAGVTEETVKGAGLLLLLFVLRDEFDNTTDGIIYGALIGAGFAMVENFGYFATSSQQSLAYLIVGRIMLGWLDHSTFTACFGAGLGYARQIRSHWKKVMIPLGAYLLSVLLHSFFDFIDFEANAAVHSAPNSSVVSFLALIAIMADYIPPLITQLMLAYILIRSLAHETAIIREYLAREVVDGIVTPDEYTLLQRSFRRTRLEREVLYSRGLRAWLTIKALYQTEIGLAFRKWHVDMGDKPKAGQRQPEDAYRERIQQLRLEFWRPYLAEAPAPYHTTTP
jgi:RsiW-degrading membrane proteinase PrsW (M82 family)